jgi:hypothetical protein
MKRIKKTALDLLDDIYSLAYWMTGNEEVSKDLVHCTYLSASSISGERELLKGFRECYVTRFGQQADFCTTEKSCQSHLQLFDSPIQWAADIKLSVVLSEISGLKHSQISEIVGKPVETVRLWLLWGRKLFSLSNPVTFGQLKAS